MKITVSKEELQVIINALIASDPMKIYLGDLVVRIAKEWESQIKEKKDV